ncbi:hypothetical protein IAQ61_009162 [Plenodomus lingam]|uniref:uncharacterized protein n=1 Tax=Leptosphaeria maculans TaxID=5022 RepID=UPI003330E8A6|nr:hypothetical protein IAQ61_009162 [Plenodomus lingam]
MPPLQPTLTTPYKHISSTPIPTSIYLPPPSPTHPKACPVLLMIHGGAFMLGHAGLNNKDQIQDCLDRGWIVLALEHRLCPGVDMLEGPVTDVRDALAWVYEGGLGAVLEGERVRMGEGWWGGEVDVQRVVVMGTSSGGHLALCTVRYTETYRYLFFSLPDTHTIHKAFNTPRPPLAILDFYGPKNFAHPFWKTPLSCLADSFQTAPPATTHALLTAQKTLLVGGPSLEGQTPTSSSSSSPPDPHASLRFTYTMHKLATGTLLPTIWPAYPANLHAIDPMANVNGARCAGGKWPPVGIVHGVEDEMVPVFLSRGFAEALRGSGQDVELFEVEGEGHTFCGGMERGGRTWGVQRRGWEWLAGVVGGSYEGGVGSG